MQSTDLQKRERNIITLLLSELFLSSALTVWHTALVLISLNALQLYNINMYLSTRALALLLAGSFLGELSGLFENIYYRASQLALLLLGLAASPRDKLLQIICMIAAAELVFIVVKRFVRSRSGGEIVEVTNDKV